MPKKQDQPIPLLITLADMVELFPVGRQSVYRWNSTTGGRRRALPEPDRVIARTPVWREEVVREFARQHGYELNEEYMEKLRRDQGVV